MPFAIFPRSVVAKDLDHDACDQYQLRQHSAASCNDGPIDYISSTLNHSSDRKASVEKVQDAITESLPVSPKAAQSSALVSQHANANVQNPSQLCVAATEIDEKTWASRLPKLWTPLNKEYADCSRIPEIMERIVESPRLLWQRVSSSIISTIMVYTEKIWKVLSGFSCFSNLSDQRQKLHPSSPHQRIRTWAMEKSEDNGYLTSEFRSRLEIVLQQQMQDLEYLWESSSGLITSVTFTAMD